MIVICLVYQKLVISLQTKFTPGHDSYH